MANMPMVPGAPVGAAMPMMANGGVAPPAGLRPQQPSEANKNLLNTYIYEYFLRNDMFECARALLRSDPQIKVQDGPNARRDENGNLVVSGAGDSMDVDNKDSIDSKGPEGLPQPSIPNPSLDNPFLYEWFCLFWDMFNAQKGKSANVQVNSYMNHTQNQSRLRQNQQQELLRNMRPDMTPAQQQQLQMMRMQNTSMNMAMKQPNNIAQRAMANNQNNPQMIQMLQQQKQGQMQRDPSDMDGNRARQSSPGSAENAPSPLQAAPP
ncbi:hypothetical protein OPQ81_005045 [Rhizoctonia solani]|nr:hypothetical protein OPQ81_005045 [Rhizoctonia solani]